MTAWLTNAKVQFIVPHNGLILPSCNDATLYYLINPPVFFLSRLGAAGNAMPLLLNIFIFQKL